MSSSRLDKEDNSKALLRMLSFFKVKFVRYLALDVCNNVRCKVVPIERLKRIAGGDGNAMDPSVAIAKVCFGGLPSFGDVIQPESGFNAQYSLVVKPDLSTLRVLPYSSESAVVFGNLVEERTRSTSDLCCRSLLQRVAERAARELNLYFTVGAELEFSLYDATTDQPVEYSNFADTTILNQQQDFIGDLYNQLIQQEIPIELLHAESSPGQFEIVLSYERDPTVLADNVLVAKETIRAVARLHGLKAIFLPKIDFSKAGNGLHVHLSFCDITTGANKFKSSEELSHPVASESPEALSPDGKSFIEGILVNLPAILGLTLPTKKSFLRVGPGCWTGSEASWGFDDKECGLRVVGSNDGKSWGRVEFKFCDATANLYLALSGILIAGIDGMSKKLAIRPMKSDTENISSFLPKSPDESLKHLKENKLFGCTIPPAMLKGYIALRRAEYNRASEMSIEIEVKESLLRA